MVATKVAEMLKFVKKKEGKKGKRSVRKGKRRERNEERGRKEGKERRLEVCMLRKKKKIYKKKRYCSAC